MTKKTTGAILATVVAGMVFAGHAMATDAPAPTTTAKVKCSGTNSCKGTGACKSATNSCKGQNGCKGKGWVEVDSEKACTDQKGTVVKS